MEIERSTFCQSFSTYMSYKRMMILTCNRFVQLTMWLIYSPSLLQLKLLRRWCTRSGCKSSRMFSLGWANMHCALFSFQGFVPPGFPCKVFNEATYMRIVRDVYSFFFTRFFFHLIFSSKVLTRHIIYLDIQGGVL